MSQIPIHNIGCGWGFVVKQGGPILRFYEVWIPLKALAIRLLADFG